LNAVAPDFTFCLVPREIDFRRTPARQGDVTTVRKPIRKAVFPVAGLGTRFLPATKAIPKEMLPIIDRPLIQYAVDEAREAGIEQLIFVTGRGKTAIVEHFDTAFELESTMSERGKQLDALAPTRIQPGNLVTVRQQVPLGLGHAIWCARAIVGDEPFAIFLPDELMIGEPGCMKQMVEAYNEVGGNLISVLEVPEEEVSSYGVISPDLSADLGEGIYRVKDLVEKPPRSEAPSDLAIIGRYILTPDIFPALDAIKSDRTGEIQLTNGIRELLKTRPVYACEVKGVRHDTGNKLGFLKAVVYFALRRPDIADKFSAYLGALDLGALAKR